MSWDDEVTDDEIERAGVDVGEPFSAPLALASACESAERYEAADAMAERDVPDFFLNIEGVVGLETAMGDGSGELNGILATSRGSWSTSGWFGERRGGSGMVGVKDGELGITFSQEEATPDL